MDEVADQATWAVILTTMSGPSKNLHEFASAPTGALKDPAPFRAPPVTVTGAPEESTAEPEHPAAGVEPRVA